MPRIVDNPNENETWKNASRGKVVLKRQGRGGELIDEVIVAGKTFHLTPNERRLNQEMCASDSLDPFQNGLLSPVKLIETAEDVESLKGNPNHLSDSDMSDLFKVRTLKAFTERVNAVTNPLVLTRLLEIARSDDVDSTYKQMKVITGRLQEVAPSLYSEVQSISSGDASMNAASSAEAPGVRGPRVGVPRL